jgi:hypothetical protein
MPRKTNRKNKRQRRKSRKLYGGRQYLTNVGYSSGYSMPFFNKMVTNIV